MRADPATASEQEERLCEQERLIPFLLDPRSYPHRPVGVRLVQTHASLVFVAPPFVYKVKKAVDFGFLDFSTLEKRRHFCEREVFLNRRLSSGVYLGVEAIHQSDSGFGFGAEGKVVEYAVRMRKLTDRNFLDRRLARGEVGTDDLDRIVAALTVFYQSQDPTDEIEEKGQIAHLRLSTDENFAQTAEFVGATVSQAAFSAIKDYTGAFYVRHEKLFASRIRDRRILDCHGDLHLEHIHLSPRAINIYDCIEFNDRFRYIDIANDVAFLAMDLDFNGRPDLARYLVTGMAEELGDRKMEGLMDFYKCYRAYVRGKVESFHSVAHAAPEDEKKESADRAGRYFQLALRYALAGSGPVVIVLMGRIASGKSVQAAALAAELGWEAVSSDRVRKELAGVPLHRRGTPGEREKLYSAAMTERTYAHLVEAAESCGATGRGMVLDATFGRREQREKLQAHLERCGLRIQFVELQVTDEVIKERLRKRDASRREVSDARLEDFEMLTGSYEPPVELPPGAVVAVDAGADPEQTLARVLKELAARRAAAPEQTGA